MNCKPGLAKIVSEDPFYSGRDIGKIVLIVGPGEDWSDFGDTRFCWSIDSLGQRLECLESPDGPIMLSDGVEHLDFPDCHLRNLPGDETDEQSIEAMRDLMQTKKEKVTT